MSAIWRLHTNSVWERPYSISELWVRTFFTFNQVLQLQHYWHSWPEDSLFWEGDAVLCTVRYLPESLPLPNKSSSTLPRFVTTETFQKTPGKQNHSSWEPFFFYFTNIYTNDAKAMRDKTLGKLAQTKQWHLYNKSLVLVIWMTKEI